ncbi:MAG: hypothetical protein IJJ73_08075 [Bacteroidaceae bacterium]|nr:hypothetical protein [Bacteroidaceae bacterium]
MADYQRLFEAVERKAGRQMLTPRDFRWLEKRMFEDIHERVSASTLMRLWGYRSGGVPRQTTLDVLARFVGYEDYVEFCKAQKPAPLQPPPEEGGLLAKNSPPPRGRGWGKGLALLLLLLLVGGFALWHFTKQVPMEEGLPAGAKDMTYLIGNPTCDTEELDAWTFEHGGITLAEDSTLMYYMKNFDVWQIIHGLPAGEYELRVKAWQLPNEHDAALYDYEHAEDKEDGCALTTAEIYAGPFSHHVKNRVSMTDKTVNDSSDVRLRFVCLDDSVRIGFRSNDNCRRFSRAVADDFRLFLIRKAKSEAELQELSALRDSAQAQAEAGQQAKKEGIYLKNHNIVDLWKGQEEPLPEGWTTEQDASLCRLVHRNDVSRGMGDSEIYLEFLSQEPAKPGLLIGQRIRLEPGKYIVGACFFAQNELGSHKNALFAVKGVDGNVEASPMMDYRFVHFELHEPQEVTIGLWAPEGSAVCRAGICMPGIWKD